MEEQTSRESPTTGYLIWRLTLKWRAMIDRVVAQFGLTHARYSLLASLYGLSLSGVHPSQRELADFSGLEPIYVSKLARSLERNGLVERNPNPADPRAVQLCLTEHGAKVVTAAIQVVRGVEEEQLAPLGGRASQRSAELREMLQAMLRDKGGRDDA